MTTRSVAAWIPIRTPAFDHPDRLPVYEVARDQFIAQLPGVLCALGSDVAIEAAKLDEPPDELIGSIRRASWPERDSLNTSRFKATGHVDDAWLQANPSVEEV